MRIEYGVNENLLFILTCFGTEQKVRKWRKPHLARFLVDIITFKTFQIIILLNTNIPHLLSAVRLCSQCRAPKQPVWIAVSAPVYVYLILVSSRNFFPQVHWQN